MYSASNVSDENGYSTKTTSPDTIHTHECFTRTVTIVTRDVCIILYACTYINYTRPGSDRVLCVYIQNT